MGEGEWFLSFSLILEKIECNSIFVVIFICRLIARNDMNLRSTLLLTSTLALSVAGCGYIAMVPTAPSITSVTAGDSQIAVAFSSPAAIEGASPITNYTASCTNAGVVVSASAASSPIVVKGLTNGLAYNCQVSATNSAGIGASSSKLAATPVAATPATALYHAAAPYATLLSTAYQASSLSATTQLTSRSRYLVSDSATATSSANYLSIGATYSASAGYGLESGNLDSASTYSTYFNKIIQVVADASDTSCYQFRSHFHPNNALDFDATDNNKLKFRNNFGKAAVGYGYLCFSYDTATRYLKAKKRYTYSTSTYSHSADSNFSAANYFVQYASGSYKLVSAENSATKFYFYASPLTMEIPTDFNPGGTAFVSNPAAGIMTKLQNGTADIEGSTGSVYRGISDTYKSQVATAGTNAATKLAADTQLAAIKAALQSKNESLRYDTAFYTAFRDGLLAGKLHSDAVSDGTPGQNLVPYVYFTNEQDSSGNYHPFMVIVSYGNGPGPHGLQDVARPPGKSTATSTGYADSSVTRFANLENYAVGIPLKDYGLVTTVTENNIALTLWSDAKSKAAADVYNYSSIADNGILISGAVMFPVYSNTLVPSQSSAELSASGCHVGQGGGGPHCHADGYASNGILGVYNDADYVGKTHPPLIGFGYDGVALFGRYRTQDSSLLGASTTLDEWGGHNHDGLGYHYHADHSVKATLGNTSISYTVRSLIRGAYRGKTQSVPYFGVTQRPNKYLGEK